MIFISYRRSDSEVIVGRIYSEICKHFPRESVFLDHDSIPLGRPFAEVIRERLAASRYALVIIGPQWCSILDKHTGRPRLEEESDFVRREVELALNTPGVDVIPVWVMRAATTTREIEELPVTLRPLFEKQGMSIRPVPDEETDLERLIQRLKPDAPSPRNVLIESAEELRLDLLADLRNPAKRRAYLRQRTPELEKLDEEEGRTARPGWLNAMLAWVVLCGGLIGKAAGTETEAYMIILTREKSVNPVLTVLGFLFGALLAWGLRTVTDNYRKQLWKKHGPLPMACGRMSEQAIIQHIYRAK